MLQLMERGVGEPGASWVLISATLVQSAERRPGRYGEVRRFAKTLPDRRAWPPAYCGAVGGRERGRRRDVLAGRVEVGQQIAALVVGQVDEVGAVEVQYVEDVVEDRDLRDQARRRAGDVG